MLDFTTMGKNFNYSLEKTTQTLFTPLLKITLFINKQSIFEFDKRVSVYRSNIINKTIFFQLTLKKLTIGPTTATTPITDKKSYLIKNDKRYKVIMVIPFLIIYFNFFVL